MVLLFLTGCVLGTCLDRLHVLFKVLNYDVPANYNTVHLWNLQPAWVPLLFGSATLLFKVVGYGMNIFLNYGDPMTSVTLFIGAYVMTSISSKKLANQLMLCASLLTMYIYAYKLETGGFYLHGVICAAIGVGVEMVLVNKWYLFEYSEKFKCGGMFPVWLPMLYMFGAPAVLAIDQIIKTVF
jgi:hypothetical protein